MGRGGRGGRKTFRGKGRGRGGGGGGGASRDTRSDAWSDISRQNELFESYYRTGGFMEEAEFEEMWDTLKTDLPNSFRFTGTKSDALAVREIFKQRYVPTLASTKFEGKPVAPPEAVQAFPDELVWHMKTHKKIIRRHAPFADFQKFLVAEAASGNISRQEVVSMIPPHFLDVKPGMVVLDMCAAPGSKSAQLAEMIHGDEEERVRRAANNEPIGTSEEGDYSDDGRSTGLLIANDTDYKRAGMLVHQVKRLNFPNLIVSQHDASIFPSIELPSKDGQKKQYLKYDRILADVPCSGDGTARKNPNVWQKWTPKDGLGLHTLQLRILFRGLQILKKGGRMVYSTCSMNPVENEAVVAAAIQACGGTSKVQLVDCSSHLPNLIRRPGLNSWKVLDTSAVSGGGDKTAHMFTSWEAYQKAKAKYEVDEPERQFSTKITSGCFPPITKSEEERIPLERCIRVYPHLQDTGGFFIAILEKLDDIKAAQIQNPENAAKKSQEQAEKTTDSSIPTPEENIIEADATKGEAEGDATDTAAPLKRKLEDSEQTAPPKKSKTEDEETSVEPTEDGPTPKEEATPTASGPAKPASSKQVAKVKSDSAGQKEYFEYLASDDPTITAILDFFGIQSRFPRDRFMVKNKEGLSLNKIYYTSEFAKKIISQNKDRGMKFIHCGVVMFVAHKTRDTDNVPAPWRLQSEGIRIIEPWATKRIVTCTSKATLHQLIVEMFPKLPRDGPHGLAEVGDQLQNIDIGCCFVRVEKDDEQGIPFRMVLPLWRHPGSANLMVDKDDRKAMLLRLFNEKEVDIINHVAEKAKAEAEKESRDAEAKDADEKDVDMADAEEVEEAVAAEEEGVAVDMDA
ncbi:S-adenosyl-L-methionine-dependent methyltransferase [Dothidotthia symphoricarpi CBS 119687]|uniref:S-adenosyl-L-methionine-dependent methyltransferase n=1 Tax=Dothidotthia symphoricarpi CBS 119687 TaxID=1392245 RepID=A0A6A6AF33_9PLEO|nr:S-adenosyl-L-methionine-dependent methyltransferase [Dothidotthia symphoricarpi CBS 119687]KAF2130572.1 S-adenosyl-L-methionine-dependent methyltransferase [Dothidotthia symphoricarpi CBS 119687]